MAAVTRAGAEILRAGLGTATGEAVISVVGLMMGARVLVMRIGA